MSAVRVHLVVRGRVQGVFFRGAMQEEAERLGVGGWVRNRPDRTVEAEAWGERVAVEALIAWAHRGPSSARVESVTIAWRSPAGDERTRFDVVR
jgi:acylphosphatase